jgi:DNA helicase-2/ATP-dependent DNA helicase PcrA
VNKEAMQNKIAKLLCDKPEDLSCDDCFKFRKNYICKYSKKCRISEKTEEQLKYVLSPIDKNVFLEACPGSGKTEVVGMKAAHEISRWKRDANNGIAILTFTNEATDVIKKRVNGFCNKSRLYPHFIGTLSSFIHSYIAQPFAYKVKNYESKTEDYSFSIVDRDLNHWTHPWLRNYECGISYINSKGGFNKIYAHQISLDYKNRDVLIPTGRYKYVNLRGLYRSKAFKKKLEEIRKSKGKEWLYKYSYCRKTLVNDKYKFNKSGFANFDDINNFAYEVLTRCREIAEILSKRFPLIIVDECQDLSWIEIQVLNIFRNNGTKLHFIGDLDQSIFEFKRVDPSDTIEFVVDFKRMQITDNFRSCQPIVDLSKKIINSTKKINGKEENILHQNSLLYLEYNKPEELIKKYTLILGKLNINKKKSCILVKQNKMKDMILNIDKNSEKHLLITAIKLWKNENRYHKQKALEFAGEQISKWFGGAKSKSNYFCPKCINSVFSWRIFLKDVLNACINNEKLMDFNMTYGEWHKNARGEIPNIIERCYCKLSECGEIKQDFNKMFSNNWFNATDAKAQIKLESSISMEFDFPIITIHSSKGCTYDSNLVISSENKESHSGHWKFHWVQGNDEDRRVGYVASTRAKYLLVWGVPTLSGEDRDLIEDLGFNDGNLLL